MKQCETCSQQLAESVKICPSCGSEASGGPTRIDTYRLLEVVHEGYASTLYRAVGEDGETPVALRLFTENSGVDQAVARRLTDELEVLRELPPEWFVQHYSINCSAEGRWYRVSEWVDAESWGSLLSSGRLQDQAVRYGLFYRMAAILSGLHQSGHVIPHLILNDILVLKGGAGRVDVKIDYKLSRFLDPKLARPGPMLQNLLDCHPDIAGGRPLDFKSDIWSLGRLFTQIMSGDLDICDPRPVVKEEDFPKDMSVLIRSMLADDPDLRPGSMQEVADALQRLTEDRSGPDELASPATAGEVKRLRRTVTALGTAAVLLAVVGIVFFFILDRKPADLDSTLEAHAGRYAGSVAFVLVEYGIRVEDTVVYRQVSEGTAFLADAEGYLLTNRHVACPWLEDNKIFALSRQIRAAAKQPVFEYRMYLWFEGERAFSRLGRIGVGEELDDIYDLNAAYSRGGTDKVTIAGVARPSAGSGRMIRGPHQDDFAVLKINRVPAGLMPLPLDRKFAVAKLERLSPVIALGFPLGNRTQDDIINVSVTRGHIRRTFETFFQVDTSIYKGNSGGPIINEQGRVIGIASAVATDIAVAPMPVITPLSDIGLVLPVTDAAKFLDELKDGLPKWNGVIDLSADVKVQEILALARGGEWRQAMQKADQSLKDSDDPALVLAAGMMHYSNGDLEGAGRLLDTMLSIDKENHEARLLRALSETTRTRRWQNKHVKHLLDLDWRSPGEFYGYAAEMLSTPDAADAMLGGWNTAEEKSWLSYLAGLIKQEAGYPDQARELYREAARAATEDDWPFYLSLASLSLHDEADPGGRSAFEAELRNLTEDRTIRANLVKPLAAQFDGAAGDPAARREILLHIYGLRPDNKKLLAFAAYHSAMVENWDQSLQLTERYLSLSGREEPLRLGAGLLAAILLFHLDQDEVASDRLDAYCRETQTTWYRQICETLSRARPVDDLIEKGGTVPEKVLTAAAYLGLQAEAEGNVDQAIKYYREALGSYRDSWIEFEFARHRYVRLRQQGRK